MIKIILLTNDTNKVLKLRNIASKIDFHTGENIKFEYYSFNYHNYRPIVTEKDYQKIFIVDLDNLNISCDMVRFIRKYNHDSPMIFIASNKHILDQYYGIFYGIFSHLVINESFADDLKEVLIKLMAKRFDKGVLYYSNRNLNLSVYYKRILYIYRDTQKRKTIVVTNNNEYEINISLKNILKYLDNRFRKCHRACIINKCRVEHYKWNEGSFTLDNGIIVNLLSKKYMNEVNKK